jgi:hypothetical protein
VSEPALAFAFFDPARDVYGTARAGATLLFEGRTPTAHGEGPTVEAVGDRLRAELPGVLSLELEPISKAADLDEVSVRLARVRGEAAGHPIDCIGTVSETRRLPTWEELDLLRSVTVVVDEGNALLALARRPRDAVGHGDERVSAWLIENGEPRRVEDARISTVYDGGGRQRSAGLELWLPREDYPHRGSGAAIAGSSLELEGVSVHAAVFRWRLDGHEGLGAYELMLRVEPPEAA